jgi:tetratricopeptide (TPR) repeat protein
MLIESPLKEPAYALLRASRVDSADAAQMLEIAGYVALQTSNFDMAAAWLEQAVTLCRTPSPALLNNLAIAMLRHDPLNLAPRALLLVEQALKAEPNRTELICTRAEIRLSLRRWADAQRDIRSVLDQKPNHPEALRLLQLCVNIAYP